MLTREIADTVSGLPGIIVFFGGHPRSTTIHDFLAPALSSLLSFNDEYVCQWFLNSQPIFGTTGPKDNLVHYLLCVFGETHRPTHLLLEHLEGHAVAYQKVLLARVLSLPDPIRLAVSSCRRNNLALIFVCVGVRKQA